MRNDVLQHAGHGGECLVSPLGVVDGLAGGEVDFDVVAVAGKFGGPFATGEHGQTFGDGAAHGLVRHGGAQHTHLQCGHGDKALDVRFATAKVAPCNDEVARANPRGKCRVNAFKQMGNELLGICDAANGVFEGHHPFVQGNAVAKHMAAAALGQGVCHGCFHARVKGRGSAKQPAMAEAATVKGLPK